MSSYRKPPKKSIPFCKREWKAPAVILCAAWLATAAWGVYLVSGSKGGIGSGAKVSALGSLVNAQRFTQQQPAVKRGAVVNVAGDLGSVASGVIINPEGYVITVLHAVAELQAITVRASTPSGPRVYTAEIVKMSPEHDLALLKLMSRDLFSFMVLGDSQALAAGEKVYALGDPAGGDLVTTTGTITEVGASVAVGGMTLTQMMRTDAISSWSDSGGPLVNAAGEMLGLNMALQGAQGLVGYTVPSHIIIAHFQDVAQFLTAMGPPPALMSAPQAPAPAVAGVGSHVAATTGPYTAPFGGATGIQPRGADSWWDKARGFVQPGAGLPPVRRDTFGMTAPQQPVFGRGNAVDLSHAPQWTVWGYSIPSIAGLFVLGVLSGISGGMMTMGGGIIKVTGLMIFFGYGILLIRPVAYITNIFLYGAAAMRYRDAGLVSWGVTRPLIPWAMGGMVIGYFIGNAVNTRTIQILLGVFALWVAVKIFIEAIEATDEDNEEGEEDDFRKSKKRRAVESATSVYHPSVLGLPLGIISGVLGISGGVIEVPLQRYMMGVPLRNAIANSSVLVFFASLTGSVVAMVYGVNTGAFAWGTPLALAAFVIPGAFLGGMIGAWLTNIIPLKALRWIYAAFMVAIAAKMFSI
jgi:hypothetical protein